jgi:prolyl-tRNA editing enzyme YbaK/EbsC (Cys-tRNA(Pro) deacylase)
LSSAERVRAALAERGMEDRIQRFAETTKTSADAAAAIGCTVAQIAKSMVFRSAQGRCVVVLTSGVNRVDEAAVSAAIGTKVGRADPDFVRSETGFAIGGVSPIGLTQGARALFLIDRDLLAFDRVWAAAGDANSVFGLTPDELIALTNATPADIAKR